MPLLQHLPVGTTCVIVSVTGDTGPVQRAGELGFVVGRTITIARKAPFGGPMEVATDTTRVGIRPTAALRIDVEVCTAEVASAA